MASITAKLTRYTHSGQFSIKVTFPNGDVDDLWDGIVEHCAKALSDNELKTVYDHCNNQLAKMPVGDIPYNFKELMNELRQTVIKRKLFDAESIPCVQRENQEGKQA